MHFEKLPSKSPTYKAHVRALGSARGRWAQNSTSSDNNNNSIKSKEFKMTLFFLTHRVRGKARQFQNLIFSLREVRKALTLIFFYGVLRPLLRQKYSYIGEFDREAILNKKPVHCSVSLVRQGRSARLNAILGK